MAKGSQFVCQQCGYAQVGWAGKCPNCGSWGSLVETLNSSSKSSSKKSQPVSEPVTLSSIPSGDTKRIESGINELDRVLGGGFVQGQVVLLAGEPGIGKSTILLQVAKNLTPSLYVSGEESARQVKIRADRLGIKSNQILFLEETDVDLITDTLSQMNTKPELVIIDSIQTMSTSDLTGLPGSVGQVRECAFRLLKWAKGNHIPLIMVGHVTKQGSVAGPAVLSHIVDTVLWFEGDKSLTLRLLRGVKNRFGATDEVGIFQMSDQGLSGVTNLENLFVTNIGKNVSGSAVTSVMEGTRPVLVEIQSLVVPTKLAFPRRIAQGIDSKRLELLLAVLARRAGVSIMDMDVFVNVAGGINVRETAADFAVALSLVSAYKDKPLPEKLIAIGEIGLLGEVREVPRQDKRIKDAKQQGLSLVASNQKFTYLRDAIRTFFK